MQRLAVLRGEAVRLVKQPWRLAAFLSVALGEAWLQQHLPASGVSGFLAQTAIMCGGLLVIAPFVALPPIPDKRPDEES
jgi:hypothetical protein